MFKPIHGSKSRVISELLFGCDSSLRNSDSMKVSSGLACISSDLEEPIVLRTKRFNLKCKVRLVRYVNISLQHAFLLVIHSRKRLNQE